MEYKKDEIYRLDDLYLLFFLISQAKIYSRHGKCGNCKKTDVKKKCFLKKEVIYYIRENETENYKMKKALQEDIPKIE